MLTFALTLFSAWAFAQNDSSTGQFRGWRFTPGLGVNGGLDPGSFAGAIIDLGFGKDVGEQVFFGGGFELEKAFQEHSTANFGAYLENRVYFPSTSSVSFVLRSRLHAIGQFEHEVFLIRLSAMPGAMIKLSPRADLLLSAGHLMTIDTDNGSVWHGFGVETTFDFHAAYGRTAKERPYHPKGMEIGGGVAAASESDPDAEGGSPDIIPGFCISIGYRFNPRLSVGFEFAPTERHFYARNGNYHDMVSSDMGPLAVTGRYRFIDKRFSPVATVTAGFTFPEDCFALLIGPKIGASFRMGSGNGHLEICAGPGLGLTTPVKDNGQSHIFSMLRPEVSLRYYHTLGIGAKWFDEVQFK